MLKAKDFRNSAWAKLRGKWGTVALVTLVHCLIMALCGGLSSIGIGAILTLLISGPLTYGVTVISLNVSREKNVELNQLFEGFKNFGTTFLASLLNGIFIFLWSLLLIIPGIIKAYAYSMTYYVIADNPEITATEARKRSIELMRGNKWRLFCLHFSFIGWFILCGITFGILSLWITPYLKAAEAEFYQSILPVETEEHFKANNIGVEE